MGVIQPSVVCDHFLTPRLILICDLTNDELRIAINFQGLHFYFLGKVESYDRCLILSFIIGSFEPKPEGTIHLMSLRAN